MSASCCAAHPLPSIAHPTPVAAAGRHRRPTGQQSAIARTVDVAARVGSMVTLSALLVLAGAAGALTGDGEADLPTVIVTFDSPGR